MPEFVSQKDFRPFYGSLLFMSITELFASITLVNFSPCLALAGFLLLVVSLSVPPVIKLNPCFLELYQFLLHLQFVIQYF